MKPETSLSGQRSVLSPGRRGMGPWHFVLLPRKDDPLLSLKHSGNGRRDNICKVVTSACHRHSKHSINSSIRIILK